MSTFQQIWNGNILFIIFVGRKQKEEEEELERILQLSLTEK